MFFFQSLAYDPATGLLYITNKDQNKVLALNTTTNELESYASFPINDPIGFYLDATTRILYVGSNADNAVYAWDLQDRKIIQSFTDKK